MGTFRRTDKWEASVERKLQLLRGQIARWRGANVGIRFGLGRGVRIVCPAYFAAGDDVTIDDYGYLNCLSARGVRFGHHTSVARQLWLNCGASAESPGFFEIGNHSFIGPNAVMGAGGGITIGDHVQMGPNVTITAENHNFGDPDRRIDEQGVSHLGVVIEDDCWIGGCVTILDGVRIGRGVVIGAGAVVTRSIPPYAVAVGIPARVLRMRKEDVS